MTQTPDKPITLTWLQKVGVAAFVIGLMIVVFGSLIGTTWFLPSPWYLVGAVPATLTYWLLQRDSIVETLVIFLILLFMAWMIRLPVQHLRDYLYPEHRSTVAIKALLRPASLNRIA